MVASFCHSPTQPQLKLGVTKQLVGPPTHTTNPVKLLGHFEATQEADFQFQIQKSTFNGCDIIVN